MLPRALTASRRHSDPYFEDSLCCWTQLASRGRCVIVLHTAPCVCPADCCTLRPFSLPSLHRATFHKLEPTLVFFLSAKLCQCGLSFEAPPRQRRVLRHMLRVDVQNRTLWE